MFRVLPVPIALCALFLSGCETQNVAQPTYSAQNLPARKAVFESDPAEMHFAFRAACESPGDTYSQPDAKTSICRFLPSPGMAAYLLTTYDGDLNVPFMVMEKIVQPHPDGVIVQISYFAEVVQKSGKTRRIYEPRRALDKQLDKLLREAGGRLID